MKRQQWFSAKVRLMFLIEGEGGKDYMDNIYLFRSSTFDEAFERALDLGKSAEQEYVNTDGKRVRWALKEIISLDQIRAESLDGAEVYSEPVPLEPSTRVPFDHEFRPQDSAPTQTV